MASPEYPRDPVGYAGRPPLAAWPDGARFAVSLALNCEEGEGNGEKAKAFFFGKKNQKTSVKLGEVGRELTELPEN
jgi:hypothetical protein